MTEDQRIEIEEMLADANLFQSARIEVIAHCMLAGRTDIVEAVAELRLEPHDGIIPVPDGEPWGMFKAITTDDEHHAWARLMFAALKDADQRCADEIQRLLRRRMAH